MSFLGSLGRVLGLTAALALAGPSQALTPGASAILFAGSSAPSWVPANFQKADLYINAKRANADGTFCTAWLRKKKLAAPCSKIIARTGTGGTALDASGNVVEQQSTNSIRNSTMVGAVAGSPGTFPTNWTIGSTRTVTQTISTGTLNGSNYIDVAFSWTAAAAGEYFDIRVNGSSNIASAVGQVWTFGVSLSAPVTFTNGAANISVGEGTQNVSLTSTQAKFSHTRTLVSSTTLTPTIEVTSSAAGAVSGTIRILTPQLEQLSAATSFIPTSGTAVTRAGWVALRATNAGLTTEEARTNGIRNNTMVGAVAGSPGTLPTNWAFDGGAVTRQIIGTGTINGLTYIDVRFTSASSDGNYNYYFEANNQVAAAQLQSWTNSAFLAIVGGSTAGITSITSSIGEFSSGGASLTVDLGSNVAGSLTSTLKRFSLTQSLGQATVAFARPGIWIAYGTGNAIDITLRIAAPQLELGAFTTTPILTSGTAVTRAQDFISFSDVSWMPDSPTAFSLYAGWTPETVPTASSRVIEAFGASINDRILLDMTNFGSPRIFMAAGGVTQFNTNATIVAAGVQQRAAGTVSTTAAGFSANASTPQTAGAETMPTGLASFYIGHENGTAPGSLVLQDMAFFASSLSPAQLQAITQ